MVLFVHIWLFLGLQSLLFLDVGIDCLGNKLCLGVLAGEVNLDDDSVLLAAQQTRVVQVILLGHARSVLAELGQVIA